nr:hypothetical protein [uncultured Sphingomonas sp.]
MTRRISLLLYFALCLAGMVVAALHKGIWYDEFWTQYMARHDLPLAHMVTQRWQADVHPFPYYLYVWLAEPATSADIGLMRLFNLVPAALAGMAAALVAGRRPAMKAAVAVALILLVASPLPFDYFIQARPYCWVVALAFVAALVIVTVETDPRRDPWLEIMLGLSVVLWLNMQFVIAAFSAPALAAVVIYWWTTERRSWARVLFMSLAAGAALVAVQGIAQWPVLSAVARHGWIETTPAQALLVAASAVGLTLAGAIIAVVAGWGNYGRPRAIWLFIGVYLVAALVANAAKPILIRQYLAPIVPFLLVGLAVASADRIWNSRRWFAAALTVGLCVSAAYTAMRSGVKDGDRLAAWVGAQVARCPQTRVHAIPHWAHVTPRPFLLSPEAAVVRNAYQELGLEYGFQLDGPPSMACPTLVWSEHAGISDAEADGYPIVRSETGYILIKPPGSLD